MPAERSTGLIHRLNGTPPAIGHLGVTARVIVGLALIGLAFFWRDPS